MKRSPTGAIVATEWLKTPALRSAMCVRLGEWCVMPNHFHGLVIFGDPDLPSYDRRLPDTHTDPNQFGPQQRNLAALMRGFKGACTRIIRQRTDNQFRWQPRYYDHIVRDLTSYEHISAYIADNPRRWQEDRFYS